MASSRQSCKPCEKKNEQSNYIPFTLDGGFQDINKLPYRPPTATYFPKQPDVATPVVQPINQNVGRLPQYVQTMAYGQGGPKANQISGPSNYIPFRLDGSIQDVNKLPHRPPGAAYGITTGVPVCACPTPVYTPSPFTNEAEIMPESTFAQISHAVTIYIISAMTGDADRINRLMEFPEMFDDPDYKWMMRRMLLEVSSIEKKGEQDNVLAFLEGEVYNAIMLVDSRSLYFEEAIEEVLEPLVVANLRSGDWTTMIFIFFVVRLFTLEIMRRKYNNNISDGAYRAIGDSVHRICANQDLFKHFNTTWRAWMSEVKLRPAIGHGYFMD